MICCDGTWQRSDSRYVSNVEKIARSVAPVGHDGAPQIVFYQRGVGSAGSRMERLLAGAVGIGLDDNILDCYYFLALNYAPGDRISVFGFSRGAYTARSLVGMIDYAGLLRPDGLAKDRLPAAMALYRSRPAPNTAAPPGHRAALDEQRGYCHDPGTVVIDTLGVFDTVGALGVPGIGRAKYRFHNVDLTPKVCRARQALALAERRRIFTPCLWGGEHRDIRQVWFDGVHLDVGGGYENSYYSDRALFWMIGEAAQRGRLRESVRPGLPIRPEDYDDYPGLRFDWSRLEPGICSTGPVEHDSLGPGYRIINALAIIRGVWSRRRPGTEPVFVGGWRTMAPTVDARSGRAYDVRIERGAAQRAINPNERRWVDQVRRILRLPGDARGTVDPPVLENLYATAPDFAELSTARRS
ncbi:hypothetical protein AXK60_10930 [Tsukamurella pseudospumae]|uniref:T6SS Phospholipase effector Tle1-like catalytic domain-containing protein n=1 Tax=Tsukamurella pseudospumae TaxID=239498 RepID=A0A138A7X9_9ACTN|nr:hypothetical protein AXK61_17605 [Tsukamurella pseudospumae]KXP06582.1 hypothetical protein AXK60_10930 [Tsukamurella pseudospumae]